MVVRGCHVVRKHGAVVETGTPSDVGMTGGGKVSIQACIRKSASSNMARSAGRLNCGIGEGREGDRTTYLSIVLSIERHCHIAKTKREWRGDAETPTCNKCWGIEGHSQGCGSRPSQWEYCSTQVAVGSKPRQSSVYAFIYVPIVGGRRRQLGYEARTIQPPRSMLAVGRRSEWALRASARRTHTTTVRNN